MTLPVFIINGFLESGKTSFIKDTLKSSDFNDGTRTLIIACEEGEEEYDEAEMALVNTHVVYVESLEEMDKSFFSKSCDSCKAQRVFVEFNGMWKVADLVDALPKFLEVAQIITLANAETYDMYLSNMKQVMMDQYRMTEMVIFNRCTKDSDCAAYRRSVKAVNGSAQVYFETEDGTQIEPTEVLPYDLNATEIVLEDEDFGMFYMDAMDHPEHYEDKILKAKVVVYKPKEYNGKHCFAPGRFAMTCCVEDIRYIGFKCMLSPTAEKELDRFKDRDFIHLKAKCKTEFVPEYQGQGLVMYAMEIEEAAKPEDDLVYFN